MKVAIQNFQSLRNVTLQFEGLTVITGKSNLGKSALARAIAGAFYGIPGDFFVSNGADRSAVGVKLEDGTLLEWYKVRQGKNSPGKETNIKINGQKSTKIGREHSALTEGIGVREIKTTYANLRPQYAAQSDQPFLLSENPATIAELLQVLGRVDVVTEAQRRAKADLKQTQDEGRLRDLDLTQAKVLFSQLSGTKKLRAEFSLLESTEADLLARDSELSRIKDYGLKVASLHPRIIPKTPDLTLPQALTHLSLLKSLLGAQPRSIPTLPKVEIRPELLLIDQLRSLQLATDEHRRSADSLGQVTEELLSMRAEKSDMENQLGLCPTCGRAFEVSRTEG